ncbi:hypothetical protein CHGG_03036 [Chaetomium globosum CBS 148.51]|uniref:Poly(A) polymerase n=1 Tax=Chaetomium globosum (strain ATCC 6205 / CBS 148.51 / DSM 1962 / NBRC 6347 / NRRL 1970) TaxID=306901 RepID=Q2H9R8_CHAGB|nr:uncharacterized protein CHGG_03036 [Chaetomium globosum CBS 148.51]EAQ91101.1 hypothetical protein CHGG_03036 [Chaetomium globosum CBS 148.51]
MSEIIYGVTPPISTTLPTEPEKRLNHALHQELRAQGTFESPQETEKRKEVLRQLEKITTVFVQRAAAQKEPKNTFMIRDAIGRVFTYGSYRLGVYGPGSDMDTLVVAPKYVTVEQYFEIFPEVLVEMAPPGAITDLTPVPEAFVPIIKFEFSGISIDLIFCSIQTLKQLPDEKNWSLADNNLLRGLSENEVRSLNGTRVTDDILHLVPEPATFKLALRAIKLWAQRKAIYANIMGYPGGVAWAMLVARVCQLYPKATSAVVVNKFFHIMFKWPWPLPVLLKDIEYGSPVTRVPVWNPKSSRRAGPKRHRTSGRASSNRGCGCWLTDLRGTILLPWPGPSTRVTTENTDARTIGSWEEVVSVGSLAYVYKPPADSEEKAKAEPKVEPKREVKQEIKAENREPAAAEEKLETRGEDGMRIKQEHSESTQPPPPSNVKPEPHHDTNSEVKLEDIPQKKKDEPDEMEIYTTNHYIGLQLVEGAKSLDLSREVNDWKSMCTSNELFDEGLMFLSIQHLKNTNLPDDVFEPGETKPRPVKKNLKRAASEGPGNMQPQPPVKRHAPGKPSSHSAQQQQQQQQKQRQQRPASTAAAAVAG